MTTLFIVSGIALLVMGIKIGLGGRKNYDSWDSVTNRNGSSQWSEKSNGQWG